MGYRFDQSTYTLSTKDLVQSVVSSRRGAGQRIMDHCLILDQRAQPHVINQHHSKGRVNLGTGIMGMVLVIYYGHLLYIS